MMGHLNRFLPSGVGNLKENATKIEVPGAHGQ